ncbi:hypothetical protein PCH_Pc12g16340 [Penicillium rubens Wisconsin 54-1255]|uniref:Uncharacterized protein n=1 Tax=Penicillium rubens (strain ATCC 28089 / DSM 1075 / NRRL 1951 / Wisconsin 54-1255) TaxID=500485 RepID=B6GZ04_PENRW|nr:hypothetical protein PCH_Pc12g16340 [Penicillium rubens Wisconsin 54-1255]
MTILHIQATLSKHNYCPKIPSPAYCFTAGMLRSVPSAASSLKEESYVHLANSERAVDKSHVVLTAMLFAWIAIGRTAPVCNTPPAFRSFARGGHGHLVFSFTLERTHKCIDLVVGSTKLLTSNW